MKDSYHQEAEMYKKQYENSLQSLRKAIEIDSMNILAQIFYSRTIFDIDTTKYKIALKILNNCLGKVNHNPELQAEILFHRGIINRYKKRFHEAIVDYNKALDINPKLDKALNNMGIAYLRIGDIDKADSIFNALTTRNNDYKAIGIYNIGCVLAHRGEIEQLIELWRQNIDLLSQKIDEYDLSPLERALDDEDMKLPLKNPELKALIDNAMKERQGKSRQNV